MEIRGCVLPTELQVQRRVDGPRAITSSEPAATSKIQHPTVKEIIVADPGYKFVYVDLEQRSLVLLLGFAGGFLAHMLTSTLVSPTTCTQLSPRCASLTLIPAKMPSSLSIVTLFIAMGARG
jgi:hypothetical protein